MNEETILGIIEMSAERYWQPHNAQQIHQQKQRQQQQRNYRQDACTMRTRDSVGGSSQTQNNAISRVNQQQQTTITTTVNAASSISQQPLPPTNTPSMTSTSTLETTRAPPVTEQITNLLNLAQHLLGSVREQQQLEQQRRRQRHNLRLQAVAPYQRINGDVLQAMQRVSSTDGNSSSNGRSNESANNMLENTTNTITIRNVNGNGEAGGSGYVMSANSGGQRNQVGEQQQQWLCETQFCSCAECAARLLRSGMVVEPTASAVNTNAADVRATRSKQWNKKKFRHRHWSSSNLRSSSSDNINFQCSICLESYLLQRPMATQCGHIFCRRCIMKCVNGQGKCPMCNSKLNSSGVFRVYF